MSATSTARLTVAFRGEERLAGLAAVLMLATLGAACAAAAQESVDSTDSSSSGDTGADVEFMRGMIATTRRRLR